MTKTLGQWRGALAVLVLAAGCGDSLVGPEDTDFAASLGINLSQMTKTSSGLYFQDVTVGTGATAIAGKRVSVHYIGWLADGTQFDANQPPTAPFPVTLGDGSVIPGFDEGLRDMKVGGRRKIVIPSQLGYGARGQGPIPPNAVLVFQLDVAAVQ